MKYSLFLLLSFFCFHHCAAQVPHWGFRFGTASVNDEGYVCKAAPNGNVYIAGKFSGTIDIDPGPSTYNITSAGNTDAYLACYDSLGNFNWGFRIGNTSYDGVYGINIDKITSDVYICGFYQVSMDCDPGPGVATLTSAGGTTLTTHGEGFVAKYSTTGAYLWAKSLGGPTTYDHTNCLETDSLGNVYVGGEFNTTMAISPTITLSTAASGCAYIIKYNSAGTLLWGHNYGQAGIPSLVSVPRSMVVRNGYLYISGVFKGTANFNPWGTTPATVTASGGFTGIDAFLVKYDTAGNFSFLQTISGTATEEGCSIVLDPDDNIYIAGYSASPSLIFNAASPGTSTVTTPAGAAGNNVFIAKYTSSGTYQWGHIVGGSGDDVHKIGMDLIGSYIYVPGWFSGTVDFDPSGAVSNLTSAGGTDIFLASYDFAGNYVCAFRTGSSFADERGNMLTHDATGALYYTGQFGGASVDFDPGAGTYPLTSSGGSDAYFIRYRNLGSPFTGTVTGDTICAGATAYFTVNVTSGASGPYTVTYTDGVSTFTASGVVSGVPFAVSPSPVVTTTYTVTITAPLSGATSLCGSSTGTITGTATILVVSPPGAITGSTPVCVGATITLSNTTIGGTWSISPLAIGTISSSGVVTALSAGTAIVSYTTPCGTATAIVTVNASPAPIAGTLLVCAGSSTTLSCATPGGVWSCTPASVATISSAGVVSATAAGTAIVSYTNSCGTSTVVVTVSIPPAAITGGSSLCTGYTISLTNSVAGGSWSISPASVATINTSGVVTGVTAGTASVSYTTICGVATTVVTVNPGPGIISGNAPMCLPASISLTTSGTGGVWTCSPASVATISPGGIVTATGPGTAVVSYTNSCGAATTIVSINETPTVDLGPDRTACAGNNVILAPSPTPVATSLMWNTGQTSSSISVSATGTYWLLVSNNGCQASDTLNVLFKPVPIIDLGPDTSACASASIVIGVTPGLQTTYLWNTGDTSAYISVTPPGTYTVTATLDGCSAGDSKTINLIDAPAHFFLGPDTFYCSDEAITLGVPGGQATWSTGITNTHITVTQPGTYWATMTNLCGAVSDTVVLTEVNCNIAFPNAFSPNNDGLNEIAKVKGMLGLFRNFSLSIYNRWGERVFYTEDIYSGWNGVYNGVDQEVGVYFYMIYYSIHDNRRMMKGDLTLVR